MHEEGHLLLVLNRSNSLYQHQAETM